MIPLFKPATAKKDVNKTPGDGELAKLANLNRLVENVNTIVAQGLPAASPIFTYNATGGSVSNLLLGYSIQTDRYTNGGTGNVSIQSYYVPSFNLSGNVSATSLTFYTDYVGDVGINYVGDSAYISSLTSINFPNLLKQIGDTNGITGLPQLTSVSFPLLNTGTIVIATCNNLDTIDVSSMVNGRAYLRVTNCPLITLSGITHNPQFSGFDFTNCSGLGSSISISSTDIYTSFSDCDTLTSISFPNAVYYDSFAAQSSNNLTDISLGSIGTVKEAGSFTFYGSALNSTSVTHILDVLISLDGTNGTTLWGPNGELNISGGTNAVPSAGDLVKIATLQTRGATVTYNT
jgi:hypothetical protein